MEQEEMTTLGQEPTKHCSKCGSMKPHSDFYRSSASSDGRQSYCKECMRIAVARSRPRGAAAPPPPDSPAFSAIEPENNEAALEVPRVGASLSDAPEVLGREELIVAVRSLREERALYEEKIRALYHLVSATIELQIREAVRDKMDVLLEVVSEEIRKRSAEPTHHHEE